jgi:hypothetical protein
MLEYSKITCNNTTKQSVLHLQERTRNTKIYGERETDDENE